MSFSSTRTLRGSRGDGDGLRLLVVPFLRGTSDDVPLFPVQSQPAELPATAEGRWWRRHSSQGHKAAPLTVFFNFPPPRTVAGFFSRCLLMRPAPKCFVSVLCGHPPRATNPRTGGPPYPLTLRGSSGCALPSRVSLSEVAYAAGWSVAGQLVLCCCSSSSSVACYSLSNLVGGFVSASYNATSFLERFTSLILPRHLEWVHRGFFSSETKWRLSKRPERRIHVVCSQTLVRGVRRAILQVPRVFRSSSLLSSLGVARTDIGVAEGPVPIEVVCHFGICPSRMPPRSSCRVRPWYLASCSSLRGHYSQYGSLTACTRVLPAKSKSDVGLKMESRSFISLEIGITVRQFVRARIEWALEALSAAVMLKSMRPFCSSLST